MSVTHHRPAVRAQLLVLSAFLTVLIASAACGDTPASPTPRPTPTPTPATGQARSMLVIAGPTELEVGTSVSFRAYLDNGSLHSDVTEIAQWTTTNPAALTITSGRAESRGAGQAILHASFGSLRATLVVTISDPAPGPTATLIVESPSVMVSGPSTAGYYGYLVRFKLRETGGQSWAHVGDIVVFGPDGSDRTGPSCWGSQLTVPAGGVLDTFDTDAGLNWLLYCAPGSGGRTPNPTLRVVVDYVDERGRPRSVEWTVQGAP